MNSIDIDSFIKKAHGLVDMCVFVTSWRHGSHFEKVSRIDKCIENQDKLVYMETWSTGGVEGGNCWGSSNQQRYSTNNPEPSMDKIDILIELIWPEISLMKYKRVLRNIKIHRHEYTDYEYYGNCTDFSAKYVFIKDILAAVQLVKSDSDVVGK